MKLSVMVDDVGNELPVEHVQNLAYRAVMATLSKEELAKEFIDQLLDKELYEELLIWALDSEGKFIGFVREEQ